MNFEIHQIEQMGLRNIECIVHQDGAARYTAKNPPIKSRKDCSRIENTFPRIFVPHIKACGSKVIYWYLVSLIFINRQYLLCNIFPKSEYVVCAANLKGYSIIYLLI